MSSVEVNGSFYSLQRPSSYSTWAEQTPDDFEIAVKGSRYITHMKQLRDIDVALANFFASGVLALGPKLGPVLWQLPADAWRSTPQRLADFFDRLPRSTGEAAGLARSHDDKVKEGRVLIEAVDERPIRHVLEARHPSFDTEEAAELLRANDIGTVWADAAGQVPGHRRRHERGALRPAARAYRAVRQRLHRRELDEWAERCRTWRDAGPRRLRLLRQRRPRARAVGRGRPRSARVRG